MAVDIVLVSFYYPPFAGVGARRWGFLSRFFAEKGYSLAVVTSPLSGMDVAASSPGEHEKITVHTAPLPVRKPPHIPRLPFIEEWLTWQRPFRRSLENLIRQERPRLLVFTGGPFFSFALAPGLCKRFGVPYWLDFRDAWDLGSHMPLRFSSPLVRYLERRAVAGASLVTDVTPEMSALRRAAFPGLLPERFQVLENGYEGDPFVPALAAAPGPVLRLGIWGKFSPYSSAHPSMLAAAIAEMAAEVSVEIHHFGDAGTERALAEAATRLVLKRSVHFHGTSEYEAGMAFLTELDVMVVNHRSPLMVGTKVYDAIRINRPILAFCRPTDALARLLKPFPHAYPVATTAETIAVLRNVFRHRPGCLAPGLDAEPYSRRRQGEKILPLLASLLELH
ncbi:MAG: hypothetical protein JXI33_05985 [Candidatus Aminicenantes bacterium]|nr:hypothetical protein [Candidatus Aminicenantes bacterium]